MGIITRLTGVKSNKAKFLDFSFKAYKWNSFP
jgi:hypothetical protein